MASQRRFTQANALLEAALDIPADRRAGWLDQACAGDHELRERVAQLLRHAEAPDRDGLATGGAWQASTSFDTTETQNLCGSALGRYQLLREVGRGGMGVVYAAHDPQLGRSVAVKVLACGPDDSAAGEATVREAQAAAALNHPHIVTVHDVGEADGRPYLVMELIDGAGLDLRPPRDLDEAVAVALQLCDALEHAHGRGLVHRDLKPANVLALRDQGALHIKLTDLGVARFGDRSAASKRGAILGTPTFMAPEQAQGQPIDGRADLYALGVMLYIWTVGRPPFEGHDALSVVSQHIHAPVVPPRALREGIPAGLEAVIMRLLAKAPSDRYASATALRQALLSADRRDGPPVDVSIDGLTRGCMIGRNAELGRLIDLWGLSQQGRSHLALVCGEPGIGKTRMARELTARARLDRAHVLIGGCYEHEATTPYLAFVEALRRMVPDFDDSALRALLGDSAAELARLAPEIDRRLGGFPSRPRLSPQEERLRLFDQVAQFFRRLASRSGLLVILDDLQWADDGSLALLSDLVHQLAGDRVLFLGMYREIELERHRGLARALHDWTRERAATRIRLERLCRDDTAELIRTLLGHHDVGDDLIAALHRETDGNPFFVEEIVKAMIDDKSLQRVEGQWRQRSTGELLLPQSVKAAIGSRLQHVSEGCNQVLRTAAVIGKTFAFDELAPVVDIDEDPLLDVLDEAVAAQLVAAGRSGSFSFTHDKIREVLYDELNPIRRRRIHARCATQLERRRAEGACVQVEDLAHHFVEGGNDERGLVWAEQAADAARAVCGWNEATRMLDRARECADALGRPEEVARLEERLGDIADEAGEVSSATRHFARALAGDTRYAQEHELTLRCKLAEGLVVVGDPTGRNHADEVLRRVDAASEDDAQIELFARAQQVRARYLHLAGDLKGAVEGLQQALRPSLIGRLQVPVLVRLLSYLAGSYQHLAQFERSDRAAQQCIDIGNRSDEPLGCMLGHEFIMENANYRGWWQRALEHGDAEERLAKQRRNRDRLAWSCYRSMPLLALGRIADASALLEQAFELCRITGERRLQLWLQIEQVGCDLFQGRIARALERIEATMHEADEADLLSHRISARAVAASLWLPRGRVEHAANAARQGYALWKESGSDGLLLIHGSNLAAPLIAAGDWDAAEEILSLQRREATRSAATHRLAQNDFAAALLAERRGDTTRATRLLEQAAEGFARNESVMAGIAVQLEQARLCEGNEQQAAARELREQARQALAATGAAPHLADEPGLHPL